MNKAKLLKDITLTELTELLPTEILDKLKENNNKEYPCVLWIKTHHQVEDYDVDEYKHIMNIVRTHLSHYLMDKYYLDMELDDFIRENIIISMYPIMSIIDSQLLLDKLDTKYHKYLEIDMIKKDSTVIVYAQESNYVDIGYTSHDVYEDNIVLKTIHREDCYSRVDIDIFN